MQLNRWHGCKQVDRTTLHQPKFSDLRVTAALLIPLACSMSACEAGRSYERTADGSIQYLDQFSDAQKAEARDRIVRTLNRGLESYELQIGDEFEVFFAIARKPTVHEYRISAGDKLRLEFLGEADTNRADNNRMIQVRPDGRISVPLLGSVMAAGKTTDALARELEQQYAGILNNPHVTINETETHSPIEEFIASVGTQRERTVLDKVLPDGSVSLPVLRPLQARGRTVRDLERDIDAAYAKAGLDISVTLLPRNLRAGTALVFGEVHRPGRIDTDRPQTVLMMIAHAGGVLTSGSLKVVRVFYVGDDGLPRMRSINLEDEIDGLKLDEDMIVPKNAVIYVPPTELAKTGRLLDQVLRDILRFQGFSFGATYLFNQPSGGGSTVVLPP
ncbi:MAG: polysaccharide biosynthesis/export family protein [Stellaceae bacterium]